MYFVANKLIETEKIKEISSGYNEKQRVCNIVGITNNYIYLTRYEDEEKVEGATYVVKTPSGDILYEFKTNGEGCGGVVGLDFGEYYIEEVSVPEGVTLKENKYKVIISALDTSYSIEIK